MRHLIYFFAICCVSTLCVQELAAGEINTEDFKNGAIPIPLECNVEGEVVSGVELGLSEKKWAKVQKKWRKIEAKLQKYQQKKSNGTSFRVWLWIALGMWILGLLLLLGSSALVGVVLLLLGVIPWLIWANKRQPDILLRK